MKRLGIAEYKTIINVLASQYDFELTDYAFTSLKWRFERAMARYNFLDVDDLTLRLKSDTVFFDSFITDVVVPETEIFRDPSMWQKLRDAVLPNLADRGSLTFLVPETTNGYELFTLLIVLREKNLLNKSKIIATHPSQKVIENISKRIIEPKRNDVNEANYSRYIGTAQFENYIVRHDIRMELEESLYTNVELYVQDIFKQPLKQKFDFILFRNKMLYYNSKLQCNRLEKINSFMQIGGFLAVGINENIKDCPAYKKLLPVDKKEQIYKKVS